MLAAFILTVGAVALCAHAAPTLLSRTSYVADFTDGPNPDGEPIFGTPYPLPGLYDGLYYSVFESYIGPYHLGPGSGIYPQSPYIGATFGSNPDSFSLPASSTPSTASISVNYEKSKALNFDLSSFAFGCTGPTVLTNPDNGDSVTIYNPSNCTLTVKGYRTTLQKLPSAIQIPDVTATFSYVPQSTPNEFLDFLYVAPMQPVALPKTFRGLRTVTFTVSNKTAPAGADAMLAAYLDDLFYTVLSL